MFIRLKVFNTKLIYTGNVLYANYCKLTSRVSLH